MELFLCSFGAIGLPLIIIYLDLKYGIKEILELSFRWISKIINLFKNWNLKEYKNDFELSGFDSYNGEWYIIEFCNELLEGIRPLPGNSGFYKINDVYKFYITFKSKKENSGPDFLKRCMEIFKKDKIIVELLNEIYDIFKDEQYITSTPFDNFKNDIEIPVKALNKELRKRNDYIYRRK